MDIEAYRLYCLSKKGVTESIPFPKLQDVLGVFTTLKKACDFMKEKKFPSYWTLVRKDFDKFDYNNYSLQIVKHKKYSQ